MISPKSLIGLSLFVLVGCAGIRYAGTFEESDLDWETYGGSSARMNFTRSEVAPPFEQRWTYSAKGGIIATPLVRDHVLFAATLHGDLELVSLIDGKRIGFLTLDGPIRGTPVLADFNVIIPVVSEEGSLLSLGIRDGRMLWKSDIGPIVSSPLLVGERIYAATLRGEIFAINKSDGNQLWRFAPVNKKERKPFRSSPVQAGDLLVCGSDDGNLYAVRLKDGQPVWTTSFNGSIVASPVFVKDMIIAASTEGQVAAIDAQTGARVWEWKADAPVYAAPASDGEMVVVGDASGRVTTLHLSSGMLRWQWRAESVVNATPLLSDRMIYVGSLDKSFSVLDKRTGVLQWDMRVEGRMKVPPVTWRDYLIIVYEDRTIMALRPAGS